MNQEAQAELDKILALEPAALTDADRAFLQARRSYLTEEQKVVYGIAELPMAVEQPSEGADQPAAEEALADEAPHTRRSRKAS